MRVDLTAVAKGRRDMALPATTLLYRSGQAVLAVAETEQRPTVLGLIATGRMRPDRGQVTLDGRADTRGLRRRAALVDAPDVSDPAPNVSAAGVVGEELMFAGLPADPLSARRWLDEHGLRHLSRVPIADVAPAQRLRILLELASVRPGVQALVLVSPDRHGGDPGDWWTLAEEFARRGFAVLVIAGQAASTALGHAPASTRRLRPSRVRPRRGHPDRIHPDRHSGGAA